MPALDGVQCLPTSTGGQRDARIIRKIRVDSIISGYRVVILNGKLRPQSDDRIFNVQEAGDTTSHDVFPVFFFCQFLTDIVPTPHWTVDHLFFIANTGVIPDVPPS